MRNERQRRWRWLAIAVAAICLGLWYEHSEVDADRAQQGLARGGENPETGKDQPAGERGGEKIGDSTSAGGRAEARGGSIELKIVAAGVKQSGAQIRLLRRGERDPNTGKIVWSQAGVATSGADGIARLPAIPGRYLAIASLNGYANGVLEIHRPLGEPITRAQLELQHGSVLNGKTILRGTKEPVALAQLTCIPTLSAQLGSDLPAEARLLGSSDASGNFSLPAMASGLWEVDAAAPGGGRASARGVRIPRSGLLVLELVASSYLEGHVLAADNSPAAGAELTARQGDANAHAVSSESGAFSLEVSPGAWSLIAQRGGEAGGLPHPIAVLEGQTQRGLELRLGKAGAFEGTVVHRGDRAPLAGARILVSPHGEDGDSGRGASGPDGKFAVEGLAPGSYDVVAELDGYQRSESRGLALGAGQRFPANFQLGGSGAIAGFVRDRNGHPIEGALLEGRGVNQLGEAVQARTDSDGSYRLSGVASGAAEVLARRDGTKIGTKKQVNVPENGAAQADFSLSENGRVIGRVTRANGPLPDSVTVTAMRNQPAVNLADLDRAPVAPDGSYQLELPAGGYRISASAEHSASSSRDQIAVEAEQTLTHDLQLPDARETGLTIHVLEPGGAPSPRAEVTVASSGASRFGQAGVADDNGEEFIDGPRSSLPDEMRVTARNGSRTGIAIVPAGATETTVQLQPASSLHGRLIDSAPITQFTLQVSQASTTNVMFYNSDQSLSFYGDQFNIPDVQSGEISLHAVTSDGRSGEATATVAPGASAEADITLSPATSVYGHAVDESGAPAIQAWVFLDQAARQQTEGDGSFRFDGVAPGGHHLSGSGQPLLMANLDIEVSQGQRLDIGNLIFKAPKAAPGTIGLNLRGDSSGVYVSWVTPGSPADSSGIIVGDIVQSIDGVACAGIADALARIRGAPGSVVSLVLLRNGRTLILQVTRAS